MALLRQRVISALRDRLRAPLDHFSTLQNIPERRAKLHPLQHLVHVVGSPLVVEAYHQSDGDEISGERIHEAAAETIVRDRPAKRVNDGVERLESLPDLLYTEREDLRIVRRYFLPFQVRLRQRPSRPLGQDRDLCGDVSRRSVAASRLTRATQTGRRGAYARDATSLCQKRCGRESGEDVDAERFGLFSEPAHDLANGANVVAVILHRGRRRETDRATARHEVDAFSAHWRTERKIFVLQLGKERAHRNRIDHRAR